MSAADPIGAAQSHLVGYLKLVADTLWEIQQLRAPEAARAAAWGARLALAADEMDRLLLAIPDYAAAAGPRDALEARLRASEASQDALLAALRAAIASGGASHHTFYFPFTIAARARPLTRQTHSRTTANPSDPTRRAEKKLDDADACVRGALEAAAGVPR